MAKITPHFSAEEFACKDKDRTPYPAAWVESRLRPLCELLEIIRTRLGHPMRIMSGYRTEAYNRRIGGARASQHVQGRAADIRVDGVAPAKVHAAVLALYRDGTLRAPRAYIGGLGEYPTFTHVDVRYGEKLARWSGSRRSNVA